MAKTKKTKARLQDTTEYKFMEMLHEVLGDDMVGTMFSGTLASVLIDVCKEHRMSDENYKLMVEECKALVTKWSDMKAFPPDPKYEGSFIKNARELDDHDHATTAVGITSRVIDVLHVVSLITTTVAFYTTPPSIKPALEELLNASFKIALVKGKERAKTYQEENAPTDTEDLAREA